MPQYNYETGQMEETDEERKRREEAEKAAGNTVVGETRVKQYQDGSQTETVTKEVPAPSFGDRLGQMFTRAGENFVNNVTSAPDRFANNLNRGIESLTTAPARFMQNVQAIPGQAQQRMAPVAPSGFQGQTDEFGGVDQAIARQAQQQAPMAPPSDDVFNRMIQAESGGRQTDAQGQVLTSPRGALGIAQVMPTTAMDPGYGVPNIFDLAQKRGIPFQNRDRATAEQLLGNRALNQEFGQNYYAAMNKRFDGGPAAVAAYNAGPGRVQQNMAQNQGQLNMAQLPQETQSYVQKVGMPTPQAQPQAQPQPLQNVSPDQLAQQSQYSLATGQGNQGIRIPGLMPVTQMPNPTEQAIDRYQAIQDQPDELMKFAFNPNTPDYLKQRAKDQIVQSYDSQKKESQAQAALATMNQNEIARTFTKKSEGNSVGDWAQYLLFRHVGLTDLANKKGEELGIGHTWTRSTITDDKGNDVAVEVQTTASGKLLGGNRLDGTPLTKSELNQTGAALGKGTSLSAEIYVDPTTGQRYRSGYDASGKTALVNIQGGAAYRGDPKNLVIQSIGTAAQKAENAAAVKLRYAGPTSYTEAGAKAAGEFNFNNGTNIGYASQQPGAPLIDMNTGKPVQVGAGGVITTTQTGTPGVSGAPTALGGKTPAQVASETATTTAVNTVRGQEIVKNVEKLATDTAVNADAAGQTATVARRIRTAVTQNPELPGMLTKTNNQGFDLITAAVAAIDAGLNGSAAMEAFTKQMNFNPRQIAVFDQIKGDLTELALARARENKGQGTFTDFERRLFAETTGDLARNPASAIQYRMEIFEYAADKTMRKSEFIETYRASKPNATAGQINNAWRAESKKADDEFEKRLRDTYISPKFKVLRP